MISEKLTQLKINKTNSFNVYSVLKALVYADVEGKELYSNYMSYFEENASDINEIEMLWKMELEYLYENKVPDIELVSEQLENV